MGQPHKLYDVVIKNDMRSLAEWTADNPVLQRGAFGVETDSFMYKIGDGEHTWNELPYAGVKGITKLSTPRRLRLLGGATGETYFDGSADIDINVTVNGIEHVHNAREIIGLKDRITTLFGFYKLADYFYIQDACLYLDTKLFLSDEEREKINSSFSYTHPSAGPAEAVITKGVYRITVDTDGHTNTVDKATLADLADTSYYVKFTVAERAKLQTIDVGANKYIHPEDGVYPMMLSTELKKVRVDTYGHVLDVEDASLDDIFDSQTYVRLKREDNGHFCPTGSILAYAGITTPDGWLWCNGDAVSRETYADLFSVIGIKYGAGDGSTTFNLPDFRKKVPEGGETLDDLRYIDAGLPTMAHTHSGTANGSKSSFDITTSEAGGHTHTKGTMRIFGRVGGSPAAGASPNGAFYQSSAGPGDGGSGRLFNTSMDTDRGGWTGETSENGAHTHTGTAEGGEHTHELTIAENVDSGVYGQSDTVQMAACTCNYIIKY